MIRREAGSALITTLLLCMLSAATLFALMQPLRMQARRAVQDTGKSNALEYAESGVSIARQYLKSIDYASSILPGNCKAISQTMTKGAVDVSVCREVTDTSLV